MNNSTFAIMMARHCQPEYAALLIQVVARHCDHDVQYRLINAITRNSGIAHQCQTQESRDMLYAITERLFNEAAAESISVQDDGQWALIMEGADADRKAFNHPDLADEFHAVIRPLVESRLPLSKRQRQKLAAELTAAHQKLMDISWRQVRSLRSQL